jgi:hypothetical protein
MPRLYHSPSSIALGSRCRRLWAYAYVDKIRDPDVPWSEELAFPRWDQGKGMFQTESGLWVTAQQRGASLGGGLHATAERYFDPKRGEPDWDWFPGQVLHAGLHLLPQPEALRKPNWFSIEKEIGRVPLPKRADARPDAPTVSLEINGIKWAGRRDFLGYAPEEWKRLRVKAPDGLAILDYKSTSNIAERALTRDELRDDAQGNIYAIDLCEDLGLKSVPGRWVYFESKRVRRALPIDVTFELSRSYDIIGPLADLARELDQITCSADAEPNPDACSDFGPPDRINCRRHRSNGGQCNVRRSGFGPLVQLRPKKKEEHIMPMSEEAKAKFEAKRAANEAKKAAAAGDSTTENAAEEGAGESATETPAKKPEPKAKSAPAAAGAAASAPAKGSADALQLIVTEIKTHEKALEAAKAKLRAAVG